DDLRAEGVLRPADRVNDRRDPLHVALLAYGREEIGGLEELIARNAGDPLDHLRRVPRILLFEQLKYRSRMLKRHVIGDVRRQRGRRRPSGSSSRFVVPRRLVVFVLGGVEARIEAVLRQLESFLDDKGGVCVVDEVLVRETVVLNRVVDQTAQKCDIRSSANLKE